MTRLAGLIAGSRRTLLGLAGAPGSGKSTLAQKLLEAFPGRAVIVPMDGFHLAQAELERRGLASRKGAPETFDGAGYVALLRRLRSCTPGETVYAPEFRREIEEPIAGAIAVDADIPLVITEGNYLLLDTPPWQEVRALLDEAWYVDVGDALRRERLVGRHMAFGRSLEAARAWMESTDEANARLVAASRHRADAVIEA